MYTKEISVYHDECTVKIADELGSITLVDKCLKDYSESCTTRIVGLTAEECGRLSYDTDNTFCKTDIVDHEFGSDEDNFDVGPTPEQFLELLCGTDIKTIIEAIGTMELCWEKMKSVEDSESKRVCEILWSFVEEHATHHVLELYGPLKGEEFQSMGNKLFKVK